MIGYGPGHVKAHGQISMVQRGRMDCGHRAGGMCDGRRQAAESKVPVA
ncbi:hypothetical protein SAMN06265784_1094 [Paraburkholderia susongensis]|uniref:Uncharacterized protein n=1 Tax=Paraburkholderia susongensis TaxID=1515439 RepID=A0A1X7LSI8_9BURK|nr:hypothetical protein SAMN06265784_1094 [Paraburkholderia susongensis]